MMTKSYSDKVQLRARFIAWQCLIRQYAIRHSDGRPPAGAQPVMKIEGQSERAITVLLCKNDSEEPGMQFRFLAKKTHDPRLRRESAVRYLAETYYQKANTFSDQLTAIFHLNSQLAQHFQSNKSVKLEFSQANQHYLVPCTSRVCDPDESMYQSTYWHNLLFNSALPGKVVVVCFTPDWVNAGFYEDQPETLR